MLDQALTRHHFALYFLMIFGCTLVIYLCDRYQKGIFETWYKRYWRTVIGIVCTVGVLGIGLLAKHYGAF